MLRSPTFYSYDSIKLGGSLPKTTPFQPVKSGFLKIYCLPCFNSYDLGERLAGTSLKLKAIEIRVFLLFLFFTISRSISQFNGRKYSGRILARIKEYDFKTQVFDVNIETCPRRIV